MFATTANIGLYKVGDTFNIQLDGVIFPSVRNLGPDIAKNTELTITLPAGLEFNAGQSTVPRGSFSEITGIWTLGSLLTGESLTPTFSFEIVDDCLDSYEIQFDITSDACDCNFENNTYTITASGLSCCKIGECMATANKISITTEEDYSPPIPAGMFVDVIKVKSTGVLAAFHIGTTNLGTDVLVPTATTGNWDTFFVNVFDTNPYFLFFHGITAPTDIIIYLR
jgi:hypothetical protein